MKFKIVNKSSGNKRSIGFRPSEELYQEIKRIAEMESTSLSEVVSVLFESGLESYIKHKQGNK